MKRINVRRSTFAVGLLVLAAGCGSRADGPASEEPAKEGPPVVKTVGPECKTLRRTIEQPGTIEAFEETPLVAKIPGYVLKVHRDIGDHVRGPRFDDKGKEVEAGQVLAELWVPEMEEELRQKQALAAQARASVEQARAAVEAADAGIATAKAAVREAEATRGKAQANYERWESENRRIEDLVKRQVFDKQTGDETRNQFKAADAARQEVEAKVASAQASVRESEARRSKAKADLDAAKVHVDVARAEEGKAAALLQYATIRAPYDGVVTRRNINTRSFVQPPTGGMGQPLFVVASTETVRIFLEVPEAEALLVRKDMPARVRAQAIKDRDFRGTVARSSWSLDPKTRTLRAEVNLPNKEGLLRPGMYSYVSLTVELPGRRTLPASAIVTQGEQTVCFVVKDSKLVRTPVQLGLQAGPLVEVLKKQGRAREGEEAAWEDFTGEEVVVRDNLSGLSDGQVVKAAPDNR